MGDIEPQLLKWAAQAFDELRQYLAWPETGKTALVPVRKETYAGGRVPGSTGTPQLRRD